MVERVAILVLLMMILSSEMGNSQLTVGFYSDTCPDAESIVGGFVRDAAQSDPNMAAVLLRLHFHDCFVEGCDGSILIDNGPNSEKHAFGHQGVRGYDVIESAKAQLEKVCPQVVSCADIVAMAARDAVAFTRGPVYEVQTGRRDGMVSDIKLADDMPDVTDSVEKLKSKFANKGLNEKDLVVLNAAHTIGTTACFFMTDRLYKFPPNGGPDPSINPSFLPELQKTCPENGDVNVRLPIDNGSGQVFDSHLLENIKNGFAVLQSDAKMYEDAATRSVVDSYFGLLSPLMGASFESDFADSMVKMGSIGVKTGSEGTIRRVCSAFS